jgi:hypothetical protein
MALVILISAPFFIRVQKLIAFKLKVLPWTLIQAKPPSQTMGF